MGDTITHFFANNVILTFVVVVVIFMALTRGFGGALLGRLLFGLIFAFVVITLLVSFLKQLDDTWTKWKNDVTGFLKDRACSVLPGEACTFYDLGQAKQKSIDDRMICFERVLAANPNDGGAAVKATCGPRYDASVWEACVNREASRYQKVADDLVTQCTAGATRPSFLHDLIEGFACPLGITSWCTTASTKQASNAPADYVQDPRYSTCLNDATVRLNIWQRSCYDMPDGQAKDQCFIGLIQSRLPPANAKEWLDYCNAMRTPR